MAKMEVLGTAADCELVATEGDRKLTSNLTVASVFPVNQAPACIPEESCFERLF